MAVSLIFLFFTVMLQYLQLTYSTLQSPRNIWKVNPRFLPGNLLSVAMLDFFFALVSANVRLGWVITCVFYTVWSVVNIFVVRFHGSPLMFSEFRNAGCAKRVFSGYKIRFDRDVLLCLAVLPAEAVLLCPVRLAFGRGTLFCCAAGLMLSLILSWLFVLRFSPDTWNFRTVTKVYGYPLLITDDIVHLFFPLRRPRGYSEPTASPMPPSAANERPDIILILNESFYDIRDFLSIETDADPLREFYGIRGGFFGKVTVPEGGTNPSEFELLTSLPAALVRGSAMFGFLNLADCPATSARYMETLGYHTDAYHMAKYNYNRHNAWPDLGFHTVCLESADLTKCRYGNRVWLDEDLYDDYLRLRKTDAPLFSFLLTYQNHGGYRQNDPSLATVHTLTDCGAFTHEINEYMTSLQSSARAIAALCEKLRHSDRKTIVCMAGDHAPAFLSQLPSELQTDAKEGALYRTPFLLWSNFGADFSSCKETADLSALFPSVLRAAGLPLSAFHRAVLEAPHSADARHRYECFGYYALKSGKHCRKELFFKGCSEPERTCYDRQ